MKNTNNTTNLNNVKAALDKYAEYKKIGASVGFNYTKDLFNLHNEMFDEVETNTGCPTCITRVINKLTIWYAQQMDAAISAEPVAEQQTPGTDPEVDTPGAEQPEATKKSRKK